MPKDASLEAGALEHPRANCQQPISTLRIQQPHRPVLFYDENQWLEPYSSPPSVSCWYCFSSFLSCFLPTPPNAFTARSEEHTSELQSRGHLVCRLLLEKKKLAGQ